VPGTGETELEHVVFSSDGFLAWHAMGVEHVLRSSQLLAVLQSQDDLIIRTYQYHCTVRVETFKVEVDGVLLQLGCVGVKRRLKHPVRFLNPCRCQLGVCFVLELSCSLLPYHPGDLVRTTHIAPPTRLDL
jgi:hypothetical protein